MSGSFVLFFLDEFDTSWSLLHNHAPQPELLGGSWSYRLKLFDAVKMHAQVH